MFVDPLRCVNYEDFSIELKAIEKSFETKLQGPNSSEKILEFIEINQGIFMQETSAAICLNSLGAKVRHLKGHEPLISKLYSYVNLLIPAASQKRNDFLALIRGSIFDPKERIQAIVDWIDLMGIPLAQVELTEEEFIAVITRLEYPDLTNFNFQSIDLKKLAQNLLTPNLKFKTTDTIVLFTLAKLCLQQNWVKTLQYIKKFAIADEAMRGEIAKLCALQDCFGFGFGYSMVAENFENFEIGDELRRVEFAKLWARRNGLAMAKHIQKFAITEEQMRAEIAKLCAQQNGLATAEYIDNFAIKNELIRIEIAKFCAKQNGFTSEHIQNFAILDQLARIEIAKLCAQQNGKSTAENIQNFAIADELARSEVAKLCAQQDGVFTAKNIGLFAIKFEHIRVEIAHLCAKQNGGGTARYIENFTIKVERIRIKIAKLCAEQDGEDTACFIQHFAIKDEGARVEIAHLCAQQNGRGTARYIENFTIKVEEARVEIAKLCAQQNAELTAIHIDKFSIGNAVARFEIAKLCAQQDGGGTAEHIKKFTINNEEDRMEIARLCAQQNGRLTAERIHNFSLSSPHSFYRLYLECVQSDPQSLFLMGKIYLLPKGLRKIPQLIQVLNDEALEKSHHRREFFEEIHVFIEEFPISKEGQKNILEMSNKIQTLPTRVLNEVYLWLVSSLLVMREMKPDSVEWLLGSDMWSEIALLKDPSLRVSLSSCLYALSADDDRRKLWDDFIHNVRGTKGQRGLMLLAIPFFNLQQQGVQEGKLQAIANHLSALQKKNDSRFRNVYQVKNVLHTMYSLATASVLTLEQKQRGFEKIFFDQSSSSHPVIDDELQILKNLIAVKGLLKLKDVQWPDGTENVGVLFRSSLEKIIPLEQCEGDISEKYEEIFNTCRNPSGLLTYAAGLHTLKEPELLSSLGQYVAWVIDETFKKKRYETLHNPHLSKVLEGNSDLLSKWKEDILWDVQSIISEEEKEEPFDSEQWLHTKLILDKHLANEEVSYLFGFLRAPSLENRKEIFDALIQKIKQLMRVEEKKTLRKEWEQAKNKINEIRTQLKSSKGNEEKAKQLEKEKIKIEDSLSSSKQKFDALPPSASNDPLLINLNLQKACLKLAKEGKIADNNTLIKHLDEIDKVIHQESKPSISLKGSEFAQDVKGLLEAIRKKTNNAQNQGDLQLVFTDDPIDLLLCGTDISGSCQRLDGNPKLNKGLLGYLIDGKNRLLAIKQGEKIVARCILRLLWDGKQPVVYRDRFYPDQISIDHKHALNSLAKHISQKLAAPLTSGDGTVSYINELQALGGPAPYEYCDGAGGLRKEGRYTIQAKILD